MSASPAALAGKSVETHGSEFDNAAADAVVEEKNMLLLLQFSQIFPTDGS